MYKRSADIPHSRIMSRNDNLTFFLNYESTSFLCMCQQQSMVTAHLCNAFNWKINTSRLDIAIHFEFKGIVCHVQASSAIFR